MWKLKLIIPAGLALLASPALADTPDDIVDLLGARAPGAETQMLARGYADVGGNNIWWNAKTGVCVKVHVSQGRYKTIDMLPDAWRTFSLFNPIVYLVSGFRWSFYGTSDVGVGISLAATVGFLIACALYFLPI